MTKNNSIDCPHVINVLPWFLTGTLTSQEHRQVEDHLRSCEGCRSELRETREAATLFDQHVPVEVLLDLAQGRQDLSLPVAVLDEHLAHCDHCREELDLLRQGYQSPGEEDGNGEDAGRNGVRRPGFPAPVVAMPRRPSPLHSPWWQRVAVAASVAWVVCLGGWIVTLQSEDRERHTLAESLEGRIQALDEENRRLRGSDRMREEENQRLRQEGERLQEALQTARNESQVLETRIGVLAAPRPVAIRDLYPRGAVVRGGEDEGVRLADDGAPLTFILNTELGQEHRTVRVELVNPRGDRVWQLDSLALHPTDYYYALYVPAGDLPPGSYVLHLYSQGTEPAESYDFEIQP